MDSEELKRTLTIVLVVAVVLGLIAGVMYLLFGLTLVVQAISFGITFLILMLIILALTIISLYLWIKLIWRGRDLKKYEKEIINLKEELEKYKAQLNQKDKKEPTKSKISQIKDKFI